MRLLRLLGAMWLAAATAAGCAPAPARSADRAQADVAAAPTIPLKISTRSGVLHYQVEVARSAREQAQGLMYRTALPAQGGMIFPMKPPRPASFWMKNTYIPLDLIFIRPDGRIARIVTAAPEDLTPIESGEPVAAVLEIAGGTAAARGIAEGDRVSWQGK